MGKQMIEIWREEGKIAFFKKWYEQLKIRNRDMWIYTIGLVVGGIEGLCVITYLLGIW